jgi:hypothetical protein
MCGTIGDAGCKVLVCWPRTQDRPLGLFTRKRRLMGDLVGVDKDHGPFKGGD